MATTSSKRSSSALTAFCPPSPLSSSHSLLSPSCRLLTHPRAFTLAFLLPRCRIDFLNILTPQLLALKSWLAPIIDRVKFKLISQALLTMDGLGLPFRTEHLWSLYKR